LILDISIDLQVGDMFWSLFKIDFQKESKTNLSSALGTYQTAMKKLSSSGLEFVAGSYDSLKSGSRFCCRDCVAQTKHEIINLGEESIASKDGMLPSCHVSALLREESIDHCTEHMVVKGRRKNSRNAEAGLVLDAKAKRASTRLAKEHNLETNPKTRTRAKRITHVKADKASTELNRDNDFSGSHELSADALICGQENYFPDGFDCRKDDICSMFGCWNCLYVKSLSSGHIQNILQFRCDWVHRRYLVSLLLKIGTFAFSLCSCVCAWTLRFTIVSLNHRAILQLLHIYMDLIVIIFIWFFYLYLLLLFSVFALALF
jgi:separase